MIAKKTVIILAALSWGAMCAISVSHIIAFSPLQKLPTIWVGYLGWFCFGLTILAIGWHSLNRILGIFAVAFLAGYFLGPFLEPPGDPLDHLKNSYGFCALQSSDVPRMNEGFWQYSMNAALLCPGDAGAHPAATLRTIDILNGLYWGGGASILFLVAQAAGLPLAWACMSILLAFLFMGTNRFSYFSYYSFAPSFSSLWIYWLWIALFFFRKDVFFVVAGLLAALFLLPVIGVNHLQETVFLAFLVLVWVFYFLHDTIWQALSDRKRQHRVSSSGTARENERAWRSNVVLKALYIGTVVAFFFVLPQSGKFQDILAQWFVHDNWDVNQDAVFSVSGWHIMGRLWGFRVADTLGLLGFSAVILIPFILWMSREDRDPDRRNKIILAGILPFIVYCVPLFHFVWLSNCERVPTHIRYYYRICYSSMFWLPVAYFFYLSVRNRRAGVLKANSGGSDHGREDAQGWIRLRSYYWLCLLAIFALSTIRSGPVYGKLDFMLLDSNRWWREWEPMITQVMKKRGETVFTDFATHYVLSSVFDMSTRILPRTLSPHKVNDLQTLEKIGGRKNVSCLINLHSYPPTWVPGETGHWSPMFMDTKRYYAAGEKRGKELVKYLQEHQPENCWIYY